MERFLGFMAHSSTKRPERNPYNTRAFNVGFGDLCINASSNQILQAGPARVAFATAFELSVTQTVEFLNLSTWDDLLMQTGNEIGIHVYIGRAFRTYLELNLAVSFGGVPQASTSICNGIQGFIPNFLDGC